MVTYIPLFRVYICNHFVKEWFENQKVLSPYCLLPAFVGEIGSHEDERYWEQLAHVEEHILLEAFLYFLGVFYEEAEGENQEDV